MRNVTYDETPDVRFEESWFFRVLEPHKSEIAEIREAYKLILAIVEIFKQTLPSIDSQLSTYYIELFTLTEREIKAIEETIYDRYDINANNGKSLPSDFIHTDIYKDFYKPFNNFYEAEAKINASKNGWDSIFKSMHACYNQIDHAYQKYHANKLKRLPNQKLFNTVKKYISPNSRNQRNDNKLECNELSLDLKKGVIQYKTNPSKELSLDNQAVRFLILLLQNKGDIVEYKTVANVLRLNFYHDGMENKDAAEDTRYLKRDLHTLLKSIGMPDNEFEMLITTQKNVGYKLNCD